MPFINAASRKKRGRSSWFFFPSQKVRILARGNLDGTASPQEGIKARFRQRSSRVISFLGISREDREDDDANNQLISTHPSSDGAETSSTIIRSQSQHSRRNSSSGPGLTHRLSHKFSSTFGHPTVVHRTSLRSRPSVRSIREALEPMQLDDPTSPQDISATSTCNSGSSSSPAQVPPTRHLMASAPHQSAPLRATCLLPTTLGSSPSIATFLCPGSHPLAKHHTLLFLLSSQLKRVQPPRSSSKPTSSTFYPARDQGHSAESISKWLWRPVIGLMPSDTKLAWPLCVKKTNFCAKIACSSRKPMP